MGALINLNKIKKIYCNGSEIKTVRINNSIAYQNGEIDSEYNYFVFDTSKNEYGSTVRIQLERYRAGDTTAWDGLTDWGDGTIDTSSAHTYWTVGTYTVKTKWMINSSATSGNSNARKTLVACDNVNRNITNASYLFYACSNLKYVNMSRFKTSKITNMNSAFYNCISLQEVNMKNLDTSSVTDMSYMFYNCKKLTPKVSHLNVSSVTTFYNMFYNCGAIDGSQFRDWKVSSTKYLANMFYYATVTTNVLDLSGWDISHIDSFVNMFYNCKVCNGIDISGWNIKNTANVGVMFTGITCTECSNTDNDIVHDIENHIIHDGVPEEDWERMKKG